MMPSCSIMLRWSSAVVQLLGAGAVWALAGEMWQNAVQAVRRAAHWNADLKVLIMRCPAPRSTQYIAFRTAGCPRSTPGAQHRARAGGRSSTAYQRSFNTTPPSQQVVCERAITLYKRYSLLRWRRHVKCPTFEHPTSGPRGRSSSGGAPTAYRLWDGVCKSPARMAVKTVPEIVVYSDDSFMSSLPVVIRGQCKVRGCLVCHLEEPDE